jgi:hypothetical protein
MEATPTIARYELAPPAEQDLFASLERLVGRDESRRVWDNARRQAGVQPGADLSLDQFDSALQCLRRGKGLASVSASSILVRLRSYRALSTLNAQ